MPARDSIHEVVMGEFYFFKVWITQCTHIRNFIALFRSSCMSLQYISGF